MNYPEDLKYSDSHEYIRLEDDIATIGITTFAISQLGDIVFLELPEMGTIIDVNDEIGTIESVKAVAELYAPVSGTVIEVNESLIDDPESISDDPYGDGWLLKVRVNDPDKDLSNLLSATGYADLVVEND